MSHDKGNLRKEKMKLASVASEKEMQRRLGIESATAAAGVANRDSNAQQDSSNDGYPQSRKIHHY